MKKTIVTTTINPPTEATIKFSQMKGWDFIVVGDKKTPHDLYRNIDCYYLSPEYQEYQYKQLSDAIGWNCIQRRSIGFVEAYRRGADIIATIDDDNIPYDNWGEDIYVGNEWFLDTYEALNGVFDPLSVTMSSDLWHRGYPIELTRTKNNVKMIGRKYRKILVQADLWDGDPDIDAMWRLTVGDIKRTMSIGAPYGTVNPAPFNSQNTFLAREVIPYYMALPHVGRMDDIWAAYILQYFFGPMCVVWNKATVYQERNDQSLVKNLKDELFGYENTLDFIKGRVRLPGKAQYAFETYHSYFGD